MQPAPNSVVRGPSGLRGTVVTTSCPPGDTSSQVAVRLDDGRVLVVPEKQLILQADHTFLLATTAAGLGASEGTATAGASATVGASSAAESAGPAAFARTVGVGEEVRIPRVEERLEVGKAEVDVVVRIRKSVHEREEVADIPLLREDVNVERVAINRQVEVAPEVRYEGDVTIIPVLEEVLVVEKRLMLREELRVTRKRSEAREPQRVTLRTEHVEVTREEGARAGAAGSMKAVP
jgi:stress response protein YsnF